MQKMQNRSKVIGRVLIGTGAALGLIAATGATAIAIRKINERFNQMNVRVEDINGKIVAIRPRGIDSC